MNDSNRQPCRAAHGDRERGHRAAARARRKGTEAGRGRPRERH
ncbi:hypothetical protein DRA46_01725 [Burkholderia gladioli]|nr:hypothetical protein [Burkholderia gladioli]